MKRLGYLLFDITVSVSLLILASYNMVWGAVGYVLLYIWQVRRLFREEKRILKERSSLISFNFFFFIMFSLCTYIIPIFVILGIEEEIKILTRVEYTTKYIPYAMFICSIAVSFYSSGYIRGIHNKGKTMGEPKPIRNFHSVLRVCNILATIITLFFIVSFARARATGGMDVAGNIATLVNCFIILPVALCGYMNQFYHYSPLVFFKKYWYILSCALLIVISMLSIGDRLISICLVTALVFIINEFVYRFSKLQIIGALVAGFFFMFLISFTRGRASLMEGVSEFRDSDEKIALIQDVYPANICLIIGTEARIEHGLYKPLKIIPVALTPIPFLPSAIKRAFFDGEYASAMYITEIYRNKANIGESGMGSQVVVDIFVSWGLLGVAFFFYLIGFIIGRIYWGRFNIYCLIAYTGFMTWSVYMSRQSLFDPYRDITWMVLIFIVLYHLKFHIVSKQQQC